MTAPRFAEFAEWLAAELGITAPIITLYGFHLRSAGLVSKTRSGRGSGGGAPVTTPDAAATLISLIASPTAAGAPDALNSVGAFEFVGAVRKEVDPSAPHGIPFEISVDDHETLRGSLRDWIERAIDDGRRGVSLPPNFRLLFITASDRVAWADFAFTLPDGTRTIGMALFAPAEQFATAAAVPFARCTAVSAAIISRIAEFLGPQSDETSARSAFLGTPSPRVDEGAARSSVH